jgi:hypothetical protein
MAVSLAAMRARTGWGSQDKEGTAPRGGPLRQVMEVIERRRRVSGPEGTYSERVERLACGHTAHTRFDPFKKMETVRRRCGACKVAFSVVEGPS